MTTILIVFGNSFLIMDIDYNEFSLSYSMFTSLHNYENEAYICHSQLGHISQHQMDKLANKLLPNYDKVNLSICEHYLTGKSTKKHSKKESKLIFLCN